MNAAKKGDQKAVAKLFELYQVRVYNSDMVSKLNRTAGTHKLQASVAKEKPGRPGKAVPSKPASVKKAAGKKQGVPVSNRGIKSKAPRREKTKAIAHKK